jgi:hypothetical protein
MNGTGKISNADRHAFTAAYMAAVVPDSVPVGPFCACSERPYPHPAHTEELAVFEYHRSLHAMQRKNPARQTRAAGNLLPKKARTRR